MAENRDASSAYGCPTAHDFLDDIAIWSPDAELLAQDPVENPSCCETAQ
jgi:hypothetical protein